MIGVLVALVASILAMVVMRSASRPPFRLGAAWYRVDAPTPGRHRVPDPGRDWVMG